MERKRVGGGLLKLEMVMELGFEIHYERTKHFVGLFFFCGGQWEKFWMDKWYGDEP